MLQRFAQPVLWLSGGAAQALEFVGPKADANGSYPVDPAASGEKLLRDVMLENKIELYAPWPPYGKAMNCGGGGQLRHLHRRDITDGKDLLNERTTTENRYLKELSQCMSTNWKPESWRLASQTIVGNRENYGKAVVQRLPQWKK